MLICNVPNAQIQFSTNKEEEIFQEKNPAMLFRYYKTSNLTNTKNTYINKKTKKNINIELKIRDRCVHQTKNIQCTYIIIREEKIKNT